MLGYLEGVDAEKLEAACNSVCVLCVFGLVFKGGWFALIVLLRSQVLWKVAIFVLVFFLVFR